MNFCKQCGKEIAKGKKFCNSSCAAKYNNIHRTRKPWTEEQKQGVRKPRVEQICKYCGKPTGRLVTPEGGHCFGTCEFCKPYVQSLDVFEKVGVVEGSLEERNSKVVELFKNLYYGECESTLTIAVKYGIDDTTVRSFLLRNGYEIKSKSESLKESLFTGRLSLSSGSHKFKCGKHLSWEGQEYNFRSSWEETYMKKLDNEKIRYCYEAFCIKYFDTDRNEFRLAYPDFYLPETNEIIELKSRYTIRGKVQELKDKFKAYRSLGYMPKLLLDWKFVDLEDLKKIN